MTGKPQHDRPRVKVSLNLYEEDLQAIEDLAHRLKREQNHPRKWGKGNLMEAWIKEGLERAQLAVSAKPPIEAVAQSSLERPPPAASDRVREAERAPHENDWQDPQPTRR